MLLISDANVIIDMQDGGILEAMFELRETFAVPDTLYGEELEHHHSNLPDLGLEIMTLSSERVTSAYILKQRYSGPSVNDLFALELAREEKCPLLSGDRPLRQAAVKEGIELHGTLWLVERLILEGIITVTGARIAYGKMRDAGSRLPWDLAEKRLGNLIQS